MNVQNFNKCLLFVSSIFFCATDLFTPKSRCVDLLLLSRPSANNVDIYIDDNTVTYTIWAHNEGYFAAQGDRPCMFNRCTKSPLYASM